MKKERESNYELMKIMAMFAIVLWHTILHGKAFDVANEESFFILRSIFYLLIVHVNLFIMVFGFYQVNKKFNIKKIFAILLEVLFYNVVINCTLKYTGLVTYASNTEFLRQLLFFNLSSCWFIAYYLLLYIISPFLNKFLLSLDKRKFIQLLVCLIFIDSIIPAFTNGLFYTNDSYGLLHFITIYTIGAYIKLFNINGKILPKFNTSQKRLTYIIIYLFCALFTLSLFYLSRNMIQIKSNIIGDLGFMIDNHFTKYTYNQPIVVIQTVAVFLLFGTFNFKNKLINYLSSCTMGIYLIHDAVFLRLNEYKWLHIADPNLSNGKGLLLRVFVGALIIFFGCIIIESIRKLLFNILDKVKWIRNIKEKFINWINRLIQIN